jgi:Phage integrase, N-terminal SAM-like domain
MSTTEIAVAGPEQPATVALSAVDLAARVQVPRRLPPRFDGQPLAHLSHSSYSRFALCPEFCARVRLCGVPRLAMLEGAEGIVLWPGLVRVDLCGVVRVEPYGRGVLVVGTVREFEAFQVALGMPDEYWTVVDRDFVPVALADDYLRELRFGRRRAVSTTKAYAENLALFFGWLSQTGRTVERAPRELGRFVHWLRTSPVQRRGTGFGRARSAARINAILVSVRELYKHAVSMGTLDAGVLDALYVVGDDRFYPAHVRREDGMLRMVLRPLHRVPVTRRAVLMTPSLTSSASSSSRVSGGVTGSCWGSCISLGCVSGRRSVCVCPICISLTRRACLAAPIPARICMSFRART